MSVIEGLRRYVRSDLVADAVLDRWVATEFVERPAHCGCGGLVAGDEKSHELIDEIFL